MLRNRVDAGRHALQVGFVLIGADVVNEEKTGSVKLDGHRRSQEFRINDVDGTRRLEDCGDEAALFGDTD